MTTIARQFIRQLNECPRGLNQKALKARREINERIDDAGKYFELSQNWFRARCGWLFDDGSVILSNGYRRGVANKEMTDTINEAYKDFHIGVRFK